MSERRPRLKMEPFKLALSPSDKLGCSFASQDSNTTEKAQIFLTGLDHFATQHGYKLKCYGRLDMFVAIHAANEEEPLLGDTDVAHREPLLGQWDEELAVLGETRSLPQSGERYRHFEGGEYVVIAVATQSGEFLSSMAEPTTFSGPIKSASWCAQNPDTQQEICFDWRKDLPPRITCDSKEIQEPYIFYEGEESVWASS